MQLLIKWRTAQRLIGSSDPMWVVDHIVLDSLLFARVLPARCDRVLDVGSGAGVPGIPLAVIMPETWFTLLEARGKRASFLSAAVREVPLERCEVLNARLEAVTGTHAGRYDCVVMRCAGDPQTLAARSSTLLRAGGTVIASGPPKLPSPAAIEWQAIEGPMGRRLFWVAQKS